MFKYYVFHLQSPCISKYYIDRLFEQWPCLWPFKSKPRKTAWEIILQTACLASKFEKVVIWPKKNFFFKSKKVWKNAEFHADFESNEKMHTKKVISKTSLTNMRKSEKSAFFRHVFANNFFLVHFFKTFSTDSKSAWNSAFFDTSFDFLSKKNFFRSY